LQPREECSGILRARRTKNVLFFSFIQRISEGSECKREIDAAEIDDGVRIIAGPGRKQEEEVKQSLCNVTSLKSVEVVAPLLKRVEPN
jgi:hypothetical protein